MSRAKTGKDIVDRVRKDLERLYQIYFEEEEAAFGRRVAYPVDWDRPNSSTQVACQKAFAALEKQLTNLPVPEQPTRRTRKPRRDATP
jgi:hypothetical protein